MEEKSENIINVIDTTTILKFKHPTIRLGNDDPSNSNPHECSIKIEHSEYTDVDLVGLQIWNGALFLGDYIIHYGNSLFSQKNVLELASGTGLISIIASIYGANVICTDINEFSIFETIEKNVTNNRHLIKGTIAVNILDFFKEWSPEIERIVSESEIVLVSEAVYDNEITERFVEQIIKIFKKNSKILFLISMEKRYIFSSENLRVEATHYDYFFERLRDKEKIFNLKWKIEHIEPNFPQYFENYERCKELELWQFSLLEDIK